MEILNFLAQVASTIEGSKFVSAKDAKAAKVMSTGEDASWALIDGQPTFTDAHKALAETALDYVRTYTGDNKFVKDLAKAASHEDIGIGQADRAAWIIPAYLRSLEDAANAFEAADSEFVGEVGGEAVFAGKVAAVRMVNVRGFKKQIINLLDGDGNVFTYWRNEKSALALEAGQSIRAFGKVKAHSVYNGVKQTVLTRATIRVVPTIA